MRNLLILLIFCASTFVSAQNDDIIFLNDSRVVTSGVKFQDSTYIYFKQGNVYFKTPLTNVKQMKMTVDYYNWWDYNTSMTEAWRLKRSGSNKAIIAYGLMTIGVVFTTLSDSENYLLPSILFAAGGSIGIYGWFEGHRGNRIARDASIRLSAINY